MKPELFLIIVYMVPAIAIGAGIAQVIFARRAARWASTVFWPLVFGFFDWLIFSRLDRILGMEYEYEAHKSSKKSIEPTSTEVLVARLVGIGYIVMGVLFLAAVLGLFK